MAKWSGYQRFCSLARGLDLVGERWTLLIVQELSFDLVRYNELKRRLPGIGSNILSDRLRKLEEHRIVERRPESAGQGVLYGLTSRGRGLLPALVELRKWGLDEQLMLDSPDEPVTYDLSYGIPKQISFVETYQWTVDGVVTTLEIDGSVLTQRSGPTANPSVSITTDRDWMASMVSGETNWIEGRATGAVIVEGDDAAWNRMLVATAQPGADLSALAD